MSIDYDKLAKVLSLAGSDNDGEAMAALRRAQALLSVAGLSFTDLGQWVRDGASSTDGGTKGAFSKAADHLGAYLKERAERHQEAAVLSGRIAELERAGQAKDRTIAELRRELGRLAEAIERMMPTVAANTAHAKAAADSLCRNDGGSGTYGQAGPPKRQRRGGQFELALE